MPTRRPASWAVLLTAVAVLAACDAGPVVTGPPAVANPTPAPSAGSPEPSEEPFSPASWPASGSACGMEGYSGQPRADRGHRGAHGGVHAVRARRRVPVPRRAPCPGHPRRGDDRSSWRRTPTARARWPAPARIGSTSGRPGENVRLVRAGDAASADAKVPTLVLTWADDPTQRTDRPAVGDRRRDRRPGAGRPRPDRDAARARRLPARRARDRLPGVRDRRRPGQGRRPARARRRARSRHAGH